MKATTVALAGLCATMAAASPLDKRALVTSYEIVTVTVTVTGYPPSETNAAASEAPATEVLTLTQTSAVAAQPTDANAGGFYTVSQSAQATEVNNAGQTGNADTWTNTWGAQASGVNNAGQTGNADTWTKSWGGRNWSGNWSGSRWSGSWGSQGGNSAVTSNVQNEVPAQPSSSDVPAVPSSADVPVQSSTDAAVPTTSMLIPSPASSSQGAVQQNGGGGGRPGSSRTLTISSQSAAATTTQTAESQPTSQPPSPAPTSISSDYQQGILDSHNIHRANHSVSNLVWSDNMASIAASIAASCVYAHNTAAGGGGYGQNIGAGAEPSDIPAMITNQMYNDEIGWYPGYGGEPSMNNFERWGHFSQIVWKSTTSVGCYTQYCPSGLANTGGGVSPYFTVCNYSPPGKSDLSLTHYNVTNKSQ
jgi:hypothetical protein